MNRPAHRRDESDRVPFTARRDIGGGVAMAVTGILAAFLWFGGTFLLVATRTVSHTVGFVFISALFYVPFAIPSAFVGGTLCWRYAYSDANPARSGAFLGAITSIFGLLGGTLGAALFNPLLTLAQGELELLEATIAVVSRVPRGFGMALAAAGWLVIPLGLFGGWYYERTKRTA
ncbi:hypothetical protein [Natrialba asiatica]|uniref:Uncharacterized protein n=1 Tax=Natrialba asiatica (strain ATCC 700177 / DSM 12278 / JCM 9576 / FERM P-10747 / NBRC 102637 / 172P1) TaxID=29540 RepID=M0B922_NATA1|nr:hypothetical protein [Natrialba asiatica]ELZ06144.1 hypothetical protein C481_01390 [Natrialba asiatica DSM 12278]